MTYHRCLAKSDGSRAVDALAANENSPGVARHDEPKSLESIPTVRPGIESACVSDDDGLYQAITNGISREGGCLDGV